MHQRPRFRSSRHSYTWGAALLGAALAAAPGFAQTLLPPPSYETSVHLLFNAPGLGGPDDVFNESADSILRLPHGPYARLGVYGYQTVSMAWTRDPNLPVLSAPAYTSLAAVAQRAKSRGLELHLALLGGMSRSTSIYNVAFLEDRRNAQWYRDGALLHDSPLMGAGSVWATPSRYARKLRRHMESKNREAARLLVRLRKEFPDTFLSASGDSEAELNFGGLDPAKAYEAQMIADYSPFAILEFRDWIQHGGLYAEGEVYAGQGLPEGGAAYQGDAGLAAFNTAYGTSFTSWSLRYFDWSLTDPVDGDPKAIPQAVYGGDGWSPLPTEGADFVDGGFDASRSWGQPSAAFHALWLRFRQEMLHNYASDFADWYTTTPDAVGTTFEKERFFTHQIPADYVEGTYPGSPTPNRRLLTSASTLDTSIPQNGRLGLTVFDVYTSSGYLDTTLNLTGEIRRRGIPSWGLMEYSPSWPVAGNDPNIAGITDRIKRVVNAGAHVINFHTWSHFFSDSYTSNRLAFTAFLESTLGLPRDQSTTAYVLPRIRGLRGDRVNGWTTIRWRPEVFFGDPTWSWSTWPALDRFEVWRGATPDFAPPAGVKVGTTKATSFTDVSPDPARPFYRVVPMPVTGLAGEISAAWAQGFYPVSPCRAVDTREAAGSTAAAPALGAESERVFALAGKCGVPENATAVSVNLTVADVAAVGYLQIVPADLAFSSATSIDFSPGKNRANNALLYLATDDTGAVKVRNASTGTTHLIIDVNGYFQ
ncbi:MAG: hypothetical protein ACYC4P_15305 [Thermoanaerobaculia bacterium]